MSWFSDPLTSTPSTRGRPDAGGFTLIELIAVIALIAVLAAVIAPNLLGKAGKAKRMAATVQMEKISQAIELYHLENGRYPEELVDLVEKPADAGNWNGPYMRKRSQLLDPWNHQMTIRIPGTQGPFDVISYGADGRVGGDGDDADITNWD